MGRLTFSYTTKTELDTLECQSTTLVSPYSPGLGNQVHQTDVGNDVGALMTTSRPPIHWPQVLVRSCSLSYFSLDHVLRKTVIELAAPEKDSQK